MADKKMTKAEYFTILKDLVEGAEVENKEDVIEFIDHEVELLAAKAEKAKERKEKNKAEGDELRAAVLAVVTDELQTGDAIFAQVEGFEELTKQKVVSRLTQLVNLGEVTKDTIKEGSRKLVAYKLA